VSRPPARAAAHWRARFADAPGIYLLSHSVGRPPADCAQVFAESFFSPWVDGGEPWAEWLGSIDAFRAAVARLLGGEAEQVCPLPNLSAGLARILQCLPGMGQRREILLSERDFPSMGFVIERARGLGLRPRFLPVDFPEHEPAQWAAQLREDTALVLITHAQSNTGVQVPAAEICAQVRAAGALSVLDVAQSAGILPLDVHALGADFILGSCVKWLCGGPGAGFLWVTPAVLPRCEPMDVGWFSHAEPFAFDIHDFRYHPEALRFWGGTPSVAPYVLATHSITLLLELGIEAIRAHNAALLEQLLSGVPGCHCVSPAQPEYRSGTAILDFGANNERVAETFTAGGVHADRRNRGFRLSPHVYNTSQEMEQVLDLLGY